MKNFIIIIVLSCLLTAIGFAVDKYESTENSGQNKLERITHMEKYMEGLSKEIIQMKKEMIQMKKDISDLKNGKQY